MTFDDIKDLANERLLILTPSIIVPENLVVLHGRPKLYAAYDANFKLHLGHSEPFTADIAREPSAARNFR